MITLLLRLFIFLFFEWCTGAPQYQPAQPLDTCARASPSLIVPIRSSSPSTYFNQSREIVLRQEPSDQTDCLLAFSIPENSYGCTLELDFPAGYRDTVSESHQIAFWAVQGEISSSCCWNDAPSLGGVVGTAVMGSNVSNMTVGDIPCQSNMYFRACVAAADSSLSLSVPQGVTEGVFLRYNC